MDTGACYGVKKCAEIVFKNGKMVKGDGLAVLEERMKALDPEQNEVYKFLGCEQGDKIDVRRVMQRVKKEIAKRLEQLMGVNLNDENLVKAINCRVVPVAGYVMNVCNFRKGDLEELDKIVKTALRKQGFHGKQASDERLYEKRDDGARGLKSFKEVYDVTKVRVACYIATSNNEWIKVAWRNEYMKSEYVRRHDNALKVLAVQWAIDNGLLPKGTKWYTEKWERGKVIANNGKKLYWDWEHRMRTSCTARRPDLTLEDSRKKEIMLIDMECPYESNKYGKREEKIRKYQQLCYELRERRDGYKVKVIPAVIGCIGGGMKRLI